jgi:hypothetical protein
LIAALDGSFRATSASHAASNTATASPKQAATENHTQQQQQHSQSKTTQQPQQQTKLTKQQQQQQQQQPTKTPPQQQQSQPKGNAPTSFADAARKNTPEMEEWTTVGKDGTTRYMRLPVGGVPQTPTRQPKLKVQDVTEEMSRRFWEENKKPTRNELEFIYVKGMPRDYYWRIRVMMENKGISSRWIADMSFMQDGLLEILVHEERAEEVIEKLKKLGKQVARDVEEFLGAAGAPSSFLEAMRRRMKKRLELINDKAVGVKHHLRQRVKEIEEILLRRHEAASKSAPKGSQ